MCLSVGVCVCVCNTVVWLRAPLVCGGGRWFRVCDCARLCKILILTVRGLNGTLRDDTK